MHNVYCSIPTLSVHHIYLLLGSNLAYARCFRFSIPVKMSVPPTKTHPATRGITVNVAAMDVKDEQSLTEPGRTL
jgi:hypothetical protein